MKDLSVANRWRWLVEVAALTVLAAAALVAAGCGGGGSSDTTTSAARPTSSQATTATPPAQPKRKQTQKKANAGGHPRQRPQSSQRSQSATRSPKQIGKQVRKAVTGVQDCLRRHGVNRSQLRHAFESRSRGHGTRSGGYQSGLNKLRSAVAACRGELPKNLHLPQHAGPPSKKVQKAAARAEKRVQAFRACLRRNGVGTASQGAPNPTAVRKALEGCRRELEG